MLGAPRKNRNKKGLALGAELPLAVEGSIPISHREAPSRPIPGGADPSTSSSRSKPSLSLSTSAAGASPLASPNLLPTSAGHTPSLSSSSSRSHRSSYHNKLSEQLANLELGVEFKLELRKEDLEVIDELGCGNGGTVSRCRHIPTKAIMAKKVVHIATSESVRKQILRELQIMHDCSSPHIVSFYGAYLADQHICMCMEFMDKGSLDNIYKKVGPIPEPILGKIALAVVSGLTYLYEVHKIMHRDVKPSNILLNSSGQIKICDFGVSGELINSVADTFVGTSTYMSPERISGDPYTVKSDVWSLGITLVELAIGRFPFSSNDSDSSSDDDEDVAQRLSLEDVSEENVNQSDDNDETLSPVPSSRKAESVQQAEKKRQAKREARLSTRVLKPSRRKSVAGVSLAGSGHQMSILELLQYIVNEEAPRLPVGKFGKEVEEFVDATLRKEPVGWNVKKQGPLSKERARPTPRELLEYKWMQDVALADTDVEAFARSIP